MRVIGAYLQQCQEVVVVQACQLQVTASSLSVWSFQVEGTFIYVPLALKAETFLE
jgi:hypothetical protein